MSKVKDRAAGECLSCGEVGFVLDGTCGRCGGDPVYRPRDNYGGYVLRPRPCGCTIVGTGVIPEPLRIAPCEAHR